MTNLQNSQTGASEIAAITIDESQQSNPALADLDEELKWADSYSRLPALLNFWGWHNARGVIQDTEMRNHFFRCLGDEWSGCDNISSGGHYLDRVFRRAKRPDLDGMMTENERAAFAALPKTITAYRGAYPINAAGFSYTLDKTVAEKFPTLHRYRISGATPLLLTVELPKRYCVLKLDRNEQEIVCVNRKAVVVTDTITINQEESK